ncbi:MAG: hypothetical protein SNJ52_03000 [Verrucomicrobiia bacterium]
MTEWMFVVGLAVLTLAFRSSGHPLLRHLFLPSFLATAFCIGYFASGHTWVGLLCILVWPLLPWLELLTRVRNMRLPTHKELRPMPPPSSHTFPALEELTQEVEAEGFEFVRDAGWEWEMFRQQFRLFYRSEDRATAAICLSFQNNLSFYHVSISSRQTDGRTWMTWNYPFPATMKLPPTLRLNRQKPDLSFFDLYQDHIGFLSANGVETTQLLDQTEESLLAFIEEDMRRQIDHNLRAGILQPVDGSVVRYSLRGLFYIWTQFLMDTLRVR